MNYTAFTRLLYFLIGAVFVLMLSMLLISVLSTQPLKEEKRFLAGLFCAAMACFFFVNASCGIKHQKMWARGSPATLENEGRWFYGFHIPANLLFGAALAYFAVQTWRGIIGVGF